PRMWGVPPKIMDVAQAGGVPGTLLSAERTGERPVRCPIWITASTALELDEAMAELARLVYFGAVRIVVSRSDGAARELSVRYSSGFEAVPIRDRDRARVLVDLILVAHHPFWR